MGTVESRINRAVAAQLRAERAAVGVTLEQIAGEAGISMSTLRRVLKPSVDIPVADLAAIAGVLNRRSDSPITAQTLLARAVERAGGYEAIYDELLSEAASTTEDLATHRLQREAAQMSVAEIEGLGIAATTDPELDARESEAP